ncbi:MAG: helix-turn-helix domain-containing protein [Spirochaetota bacterium]|nr:MAG: helix-turn-helix domain-containing protein [Spirochaetota bacterium]
MVELKASYPRTVGQRFKEIRKDLGYTQKGFANKLQISQQNLSRYESGKLAISLHIVTTLSEMGYDTNWLLYEKGYMKVTDNESAKDKVIKLEAEITRLNKRIEKLEAEKEKLNTELIQRLSEIVELQKKLINNKKER